MMLEHEILIVTPQVPVVIAGKGRSMAYNKLKDVNELDNLQSMR